MIVALGIAAIAVGAIALARRWLARRWLVVTVRGASMSPTLRDGERLLVRRPPRGQPLAAATGDIAVFRLASAPSANASDEPGHRVKRIAAVAGDPVPAWARGALGAADDAVVPPGRIVVAGDNAHSQDSRQLGYIAVDALIATFRRRPPSRSAHQVRPESP